MKRLWGTDFATSLGLLFSLMISIPAYTQPEAEEDDLAPARNVPTPPNMEELLVTGSYIKGMQQEDMASPLLAIDRAEIMATGAVRMADIINNLTINSGAENNPDAFTQNFTTGTSNFNLRGLGVASTLVLLNNRRQTYSAFTTDKGENFVDTASLVPLIAVERIEILKDGAASIYGSDAVAGVINFHTRKNFQGVEVEASVQTGAHGQSEDNLAVIFGSGNDNTNFMFAASVLDRSLLSTADKRLSRPENDTSLAGFPGSFLVPTRPTGPNLPTIGIWTAAFDNRNGNGIADFVEGISGTNPPVMIDPNCRNVAANESSVIPPNNPTDPTGLTGICAFDFGEYYTLVPEEEQTQLYSSFTHSFDEDLRFEAEISLADNFAERQNSPSFPISSRPLVPAANPNNPFGVNVQFIGRVLASGYDPLISTHDSQTSRIAASLEGSINEKWSWEANITYSSNDFILKAQDTLEAEFQNALAGAGGFGFYDPTAAATFPYNTNSESMLDYVTGDIKIDANADLSTFSGTFNYEWFEMNGGTAAVALGAQYRQETLDYNYDENSNLENFLFFIGNRDFEADRDVSALFSEFMFPFTGALSLQVALRSENYGDDIDSTDPKLALLWRPNDNVSIRGSYGTSFRAPSIFQQFGTQTTLKQTTLLINNTQQFYAVRAESNPSDPLKPEEAKVGNLGVSWTSDSESFNLDVDYWSYDYDNVIIQQSHQGLFNAAFPQSGPGSALAMSQINFTTGFAGNPLFVERINVYYDNASSLKTDGVDFGLNYSWSGAGSQNYKIGTMLTKVMNYDLDDPFYGDVDGVGKRNYANFGTSMPEIRGNIFFNWSTSKHAINTYFHYIDSYINDESLITSQEIESHSTVDVQYSYNFGPIGSSGDHMVLTVGGINVTDEDPPYVVTSGGYDSKVHDPRGALYYVKLNVPLF